MANADTVKAIKANLKTILTAQGFLIRDSSADKTLETKTLAIIEFRGEGFENQYGQRPSYSDVSFNITLKFRESTPDPAEDRAIDEAQKLRTNITVDALNVGALASSKLVSRVDHGRYDFNFNTQLSEVDYRLSIRYREA